MRAKSDHRSSQSAIGVILATGILVIVSLVPRVTHLELPLLEKNAFRQTQTALTAQVYADSGIDLLSYQTPLFGPPWMVPFELPLYQAAVALVSWTLPDGALFDISCRLTAVIFFYLSALALYLACREVTDRWISGWVLAVYLFMPFNMIYSRMCLIDFTSVAFALIYLVAVLKWLRNDRRHIWTLVAVGSGSIAATVKVTTIPMILPAVVLLTLWWLISQRRDGGRPWSSVVRRVGAVAWVQLAMMAALPVLVEWLWLWHTDTIKAASPFTNWLTSEHLQAWSWGAFSQRLETAKWLQITDRLHRLMVSGWMVILPLVAVVAVIKSGPRHRLALVSVALGAVLPILMFFNLYAVHEYYLVAVAAPIAVLVGVGLGAVLRRGPAQLLPIQAIAAGLVLFSLYRGFASDVAPLLEPPRHPAREIAVAELIQRFTNPEDTLVMTQANSDWNSTIPYYSNRRFLVLRNTIEKPWIDEFMDEHGMHYALLHFSHPLRLVNWQKTGLGTSGENRLFAITPADEPTNSADRRFAEAVSPTVLLTSEARGFGSSLRPLHQVAITEGPYGVELNASGDDPFLLLPEVEIPPGHRVSLRMVLESPAETELLVYFTTPTSPNYTEELKARETIHRGLNNLVIDIFHPELVGPLRLDPGTKPGRYVLVSLEVLAYPNTSW